LIFPCADLNVGLLCPQKGTVQPVNVRLCRDQCAGFGT
jgi:hypothetical protein